jgi:hypothetical protein
MTELKLDKEWVSLIATAKQMGIPPDEVRMFLRQATSIEQNMINACSTVPGKES